MADPDWEQVAESGQLYEAELMAGHLRAQGLEAHVVDQTFHQEPLPTVRSFAVVRVMVPRAQAEHARRLLAQPRGLPPGEDGGPEVM